jgi:hypothetical protein
MCGQTFLKRVFFGARRFGWKEVLLRPARSFLSPIVVPILGQRKFHFRGKEFCYFYNRYNATWACERCVEVPVIWSEIGCSFAGNVLEIGNVLQHYYQCRHPVVDKYESASGVINADIVGYLTEERFELIVSISTFEHIGFDEPNGPRQPNERGGIPEAIRHCQTLLTSSGSLILTMPLSYNPEADDLIRNQQLGAKEEHFLRRESYFKWVECGREEALAHKFGSPFPYANAIVIATFAAL